MKKYILLLIFVSCQAIDEEDSRQAFKLSLASLTCNKASSCRLNGQESVPIITAGTLEALV